ncbi:MAG TPA: hypothetical protein VM140_03020 [Burkholderiales bacterium]|nr:hypothetical protein [Burkholderiales bacterium]
MEFQLHSEPTYLRAEMSGVPSAGEVHAMFEEMARRHAAGAPPRALIELQVEQCLNFLDTVQVMSELPALGLPADYRLALLITDDKMRASAQFAETVAVNRGLAVRAFRERDAALRWLDG